jgi:hypothetical protein
LQRLGDIMALSQWSLLIHKDVDLDTNTITRMVALHTFESFDQRRKAVRHKQHLALDTVIRRFTSKPRNIFEESACPIVDDVERKQASAQRIQPPDLELMADEGEEKGQRVEVNVCFTVLGECLDLGRLYPRATEPDGALDDNGGYHGEHGRRW